MSIICQRILLIFCKFFRLSSEEWGVRSEEWGVRNYGIALRRWLFFFGQICHAAKSLRSLRIYILLRDRENGADFVLRYYIYIKHNFCVLFLIKSAPSRLSPIEALPQTPQGTLSLDPASPLTPGLSLRFISRSARCCLLLHIWAQLCSALPIPHSSLLIPHFPLCILLLNPTKLIELISVFTKMRKIILNLLTFLYGCGIV